MIYIIELDYEEIEILTSIDRADISNYLKSEGCTDIFIYDFFDMNGIYFFNNFGVIDMNYDISNMDHATKYHYMAVYDKVKPFIRDIKLNDLGI